jgi:hypothetical protein
MARREFGNRDLAVRKWLCIGVDKRQSAWLQVDFGNFSDARDAMRAIVANHES